MATPHPSPLVREGWGRWSGEARSPGYRTAGTFGTPRNWGYYPTGPHETPHPSNPRSLTGPTTPPYFSPTPPHLGLLRPPSRPPDLPPALPPGPYLREGKGKEGKGREGEDKATRDRASTGSGRGGRSWGGSARVARLGLLGQGCSTPAGGADM